MADAITDVTFLGDMFRQLPERQGLPGVRQDGIADQRVQGEHALASAKLRRCDPDHRIAAEIDRSRCLSCRLPSTVFAPYGSEELNGMARELDVIWKKIVDGATK